MDILNKTVVGLFDNDAQVEQAVKELQKEGFGQQDNERISVIDEYRLTEEIPLDEYGQQKITPAAASGTGSAGLPTIPTPVVQSDSQSIENAVNDLLNDLGVGEEEATFYARQVARGNKLVIVEVGEDQAAEVLRIMQQAHGRGSIS